MLRKKLKKIIAAALAAVTIFTAGAYINIRAEKKVEQQSYTKVYTTENAKVSSKGVQVKDIKNLGSVKFMQLSVNNQVKLKKGWTLWSKEKTINYKAVVNYSIDFSKIKEDNISINDNNIKIYCSKPNLEAIIINNDTTYKDNNGLFAGSLKITPEEYNTIENEVKEDCIKEASKEEFLNDAKVRAEKAVNSILSKLNSKSNISIIFVD